MDTSRTSLTIPRLPIRLLIGVLGLFLLILTLSVILIQLSDRKLGKTAIAEVIVPSNSNAGASFLAPTDGFYIFEYSAGGYLPYTPSVDGKCDSAKLHCYSALIVGFSGPQPVWSGDKLDLRRDRFRIGEADAGRTLAGAESTFVGLRTSVHLKANEQITLVASDYRAEYEDNTGEVTFRIYLAPS